MRHPAGDDHSSRSRVPSRRKQATREGTDGEQPPFSYLPLHHVGFAVPSLLPGKRWSLTPPFHPYHGILSHDCRDSPGIALTDDPIQWRYVLCGTFHRVQHGRAAPRGWWKLLGGKPRCPRTPASEQTRPGIARHVALRCPELPPATPYHQPSFRRGVASGRPSCTKFTKKFPQSIC